VDKQLRIAEDKLNSILVISKPDIRNEEGLPIMEIREELDEEGNVICKSAVELSAREANKYLSL
jgi:unconventional prefoldin RPB5 interactor 1